MNLSEAPSKTSFIEVIYADGVRTVVPLIVKNPYDHSKNKLESYIDRISMWNYFLYPYDAEKISYHITDQISGDEASMQFMIPKDLKLPNIIRTIHIRTPYMPACDYGETEEDIKKFYPDYSVEGSKKYIDEYEPYTLAINDNIQFFRNHLIEGKLVSFINSKNVYVQFDGEITFKKKDGCLYTALGNKDITADYFRLKECVSHVYACGGADK